MNKPRKISIPALAGMYGYLDELRESGVTNMYGARPYLEAAYPSLKKNKLASKVLVSWMKTFGHGDDIPMDRAYKGVELL